MPCVHACARLALALNEGQTDAKSKEFERKCDYLVRRDRGGSRWLSGAQQREEEEEEEEDGSEPRGALLRTAAPHSEKASAPRLGHSHHWRN